MNLWVAHDATTRAEAMIMSSVSNNFISTKTSGPVPGEVQDAIVGCGELTRNGVVLDKFHAMALFQNVGIDPPHFEGDASTTYTGQEVVSMLFQAAPVNYSRPPTFFNEVYAPHVRYDPKETKTVMERGRLTGVLDKEAIGAKASGGLFHLISREYGPQRALDMIYALQQMSLQLLLYKGFTIGTADLAVSAEALQKIREIVSGVLVESQLITDRLTRGEIIPPIGMTTHEFYEKLQINALKPNDRDLLRWVLSSIRPESNGLFKMVSFGSKGNNANIIHIMAIISQILINGERIREQFAFRRTSPYWPRFATDPGAYGYVANSYMSGMTSDEFIFSDMNGRFDLINKALSTSVTGYFMRKGVMSNQSTILDNYRRCAKDTQVVQLLYGEDGLDARQMQKVEFRTIPLSNAALRALAYVDVKDALTKGRIVAEGKGAPGDRGATAAEAQSAVDVAFAKIVEDRDAYRDIFRRVEASNFQRPMNNNVMLPVNVANVVNEVFIAAAAASKTEPVGTTAGLVEKIERVWDACARFPYLLINEIQEKRRSRIPEHLSAATSLLTMVMRAELSPAVLVRMADAQLTFVLDSIRERYSLSLIDYGTAVGILACQAVSEPLTQYMLDSHHRSVSGGTNKAGLIRVSEIYGARPVEEEQSPGMLLPLKARYAQDSVKAQEIANSIEFMILRRFVWQYDILYEPYDALKFPTFKKDSVWVKEFERNHPLLQPPPDLTNWCFRFVIDKSMLVLKSISLEHIVERLRAKHPNLFIVHTPESAPTILMRVFVRSTQFKRGAEDTEHAEDLLNTLLDTSVRGIRGIMTAAVEKITRTVPGPDGALVKESRYAISTVGTNLYGIMTNRYIDHTEAISTSVGDTLKMFGIEAARVKIITETRSFMEGSTPNLRHLMIYADEMTRSGKVTSVERSGLGAREPSNVLLRMAASAPIQVLTEAMFNCTKGRVYGIAAPQLLGAMPKIGTLYNDLVVDEGFVAKNTRSVDSVLEEL